MKTGVSFDFAIRVPQWTTDQASIELSSLGNSSALKPDTNGLHHIPINQGTTVFTVTLPMQIDVVNRNRSIGVYYGPLLYAADIQYNDTSHQPLNWTDRTPLGNSEVDPRSQDHVLVPTSPWQYAIDSQTISVESKLPDSDMLPSPIFTRDSPPTCLWVDAYPVDWPVDHDTAALPPVAPSTDPATKIRLKLIPFAAAKLHTAQFPVVGT